MPNFDVLKNFSDKSIKLLQSISSDISKDSEVSIKKVISEISKSDSLLKSHVKAVGISADKENSNAKIKVEKWLTTAFYEAHLADSEKVENHHLLHAILLHANTEKYFKAKKLYFSGYKNQLDKDLSRYVQDLNALSSKRKEKFIGRNSELTKLIVSLATEGTKPVLILADEGAGKTSLMVELARKINKKEVPLCLLGAKVVRINFSSIIGLISGDQSSVSPLFLSKYFTYITHTQKKESEKIILFLDDFRVGTNFFVGVDSKENLNDILLVAAAETDLLEGPFESSINRFWDILSLGQLSDIEYLEILKENVKFKYKKTRVAFDEKAITKIIELTKGGITYPTAMPGAGIKAIDLLVSYKRHMSNDYDLIKSIRKDVERKFDSTDLRTVYEEMLSENSKINVTESDVLDFFSFQNGKEVSSKKNTFNLPALQDIENFMKKRIIGQDSAVEALTRALRISSMKLNTSARPVGTFMFLGPTGVGKTHSAKVLGQALYGFRDKNKIHPANFLRIDMSEYSEKHSVSKLFGAPPGYIGYDDKSALLDFVKEYPSSVVLFDEIDKAHPEVLNSLLHIMDEAEVRNNFGEIISFEDVIIIMTSNHGAELLSKKSIGYNEATSYNKTKKRSNIQKEVLEEVPEKMLISNLKKVVRPEFLNRFDDIIVFQNLSSESYLKILDLMIDPIVRRLKESGIKLKFSKTSKKLIIDMADCREYGARELKRVLNKEVTDEISKILLKSPSVKSITVKKNKSNLVFISK